MESDPEKINDADRQLEARIFEIGSAYAESNAADKVKNKKRADNRKKIGDLGLRVDAYQVGVKIVKDLTPEEIKDYIRDLRLVVKVLGGRQAELFPDEVLKSAKRMERAKERAKKLTGKEGAPDPDTNPRSKPKASSAKKPKAGKVDIVAQTGVTTEESPLVADAEQSEGANVLDGMLASTKARGAEETGKPQSQSEIARQKLEDAKLA